MQNNWNSAGQKKRSGVLVPLFSLYSRNSFGIGDFEDLKLLVDWCEKTGNSIIQLLPVNEVGDNFCPYESISSFAIDPMYIPAGRTGGINFNMPGLHVNYGIKNKKISILRRMYREKNAAHKRDVSEFREKNDWWLEDFCMFKIIERKFQNKPWDKWPDAYRNRSPRLLKTLKFRQEADMNFEIWMQWLACQSFKSVKSYANDKGVLIKGDMPVAVSRNSADVWANPELFKLNLAVGAPPDVFSRKGQRWGNPGMPPYNWENIASNGYRYIRERLNYAQQFYDMLRIDHITGLFRIWNIPVSEPVANQGLNGFFDPGDESEWRQHGRQILEAMLTGTNMLLCGEDLGVVPDLCRETMNQLGIPGIDVQRWTKDWGGTEAFMPPEQYRPLSVAALSTHDTSVWEEWWTGESSSEERRQLRSYFKHLDSEAPIKNAALTASALRFILKTSSVFSIQLIFDWLNTSKGVMAYSPSRYRINKPGTVKRENWSATLPLPLDELMTNPISRDIRTLVEFSGRAL